MSEISTNLIAVDSMIKIMLTAQQQVAIDMNTIYDALQQVIGTANRGAVDPLEEYLVKMSPFGSDDDDGGMINQIWRIPWHALKHFLINTQNDL